MKAYARNRFIGCLKPNLFWTLSSFNPLNDFNEFLDKYSNIASECLIVYLILKCGSKLACIQNNTFPVNWLVLVDLKPVLGAAEEAYSLNRCVKVTN